jgi:integrase
MDQQALRPARRRGMSDRQVAALRKKAKRYITPDPELKGHYIRVMPHSANVFAAVARDPFGKQVWTTIGANDVLPIEESREEARKRIKRIKAGLSAVESAAAPPDSYQVIAEAWLKRHVQKEKLRSADEIARVLRTYVLPHWGERSFADITRRDITQLLDHVEDKNGGRTADLVLAYTRAIANWHARRDETYRSPFVAGMRRSSGRARDRILDDDELRALWAATGEGQLGGIIRLLLTTGQRLNKVQSLRFDDLEGDVWTIRTAEREKGNAGQLRLPELALDVIRRQPRFASNPHVFPGRSFGYLVQLAEPKAELDRVLKFKRPWVLHDLRRSARSLMSRAGVNPEHAERVLGHRRSGIEAVYDRHAYFEEKATALQRLAGLIQTIIPPPTDNVRQLKRR